VSDAAPTPDLSRLKINKIIQGDLFMDPASLQEAKDKVQTFLDQKKEISVSEMRDLLNSTRKYLIPLLEYFDAIGFTARKGDKRILR